MCYLFNSLSGEEELILGPKRNKNSDEKLLCKSLEDSFNYVTIAGITYIIGMFLVVNIDESEFEFGEVVNIFLKDGKIFFELLIYEEITFDKYFFAYIVKRTSKLKVLEPSTLPSYSNCFCVTTKNTTFIIVKYKL